LTEQIGLELRIKMLFNLSYRGKIMKAFIRSILISLLMIFAAPAFAGPDLQAIQIFNCQFNDDATAEQVMKMASAWLKAAKATKGGSNLDAYIRFPIAEGDSDVGFKFVITTPTFEEWGAFTDAYEDSPVSKVDSEFDNLADCFKSTMWEGIQVK